MQTVICINIDVLKHSTWQVGFLVFKIIVLCLYDGKLDWKPSDMQSWR